MRIPDRSWLARHGGALARHAATAAAFACALGILAWLGLSGAATRDETRLAAQRAVRVAELRGGIAHLDEWLTMSAQMAAATGEARWAERYDEAAPKLDALIAEAAALATPESRAALARTTDEAHRDLAAMQRAVFRLSAEGEQATARALLDGPEYSYLKEEYASGLEALGQDLEALAASRSATLHDRSLVEMAGLALGAVFLVATALASRGHARLQHALARTEAAARTDALTGLPNRRHLYEEAGRLLAGAARTGGSAALLLLDLDRFKPVNDVHGHLAGDRLLQLVAERLRLSAREADLIARLGGDEFALLLPFDAADGGRTPAAVAGSLARRVAASLEAPFELRGGATAQVGASIGIALFLPEDARNHEAGSGPASCVDALVHRADVALYRAKAEGRGRCCFFEPGVDAQVRARALLEAELRQAVADGAVVPWFQPLVSLRTGRLVGFEMLARWPHPDRGMVPPAEFIPVAEDTGLIVPMTAGLMRAACKVAAGWPEEVVLACNISPLQLRDRGLPAAVRAVLEESGLPAHRLELEITESALVGDLDLARGLLRQLKALGVWLSLDDFGTGYSSLRHLQVLPFDKLKIDAGFVGAMAADEESRKIVAAVVGLGHSLGLPTVAEGVETEEVAALLRGLGCDVGQGWLYGRPGPAEAAFPLPLPTGSGHRPRVAEGDRVPQAA